MTDLLISLPLNDDAIIEGPEDFTLALSNAASTTGAAISVDSTASTVTTTINDIDPATGNPDGPAEWSISGDVSVDEGGNANYAIALSGSYGEGEAISVVINVSDIDTNNLDYSSVDDALSAAASGRADVIYDSATATLTYTSPADGASMVPLNFQLPIVDDALIEGPEDYAVVLSNPTSTTGITPALGANNSVTTSIDDTQGVGGANDGPAEWSISGPASADEGSTPQYTVTLAGLYQAGEVVTVDLGLTDIDTNSADYSSLVTAINTAVASNPDVSFDVTSGTLTYTAPACLLYTSPSPRDATLSRMPSSA